MKSYDFDPDLQQVFSDLYRDIPLTNWRRWLDISSREEYECIALKLSGLSTVDDFFDRMIETTDPRSLSVDVDFLASHTKGPLVVCHTSGTSGGHISDVKWFHISDTLVRRLWAPGMQAIFEASGLDARSCAAIFVPSRARTDGMSYIDGNEVVRVYSAEFSQRLVLSLISPRSYVLYEYKDAYNLQVLAQILSMDRISVVSAPFLTVLGWADLGKLRRGLEKSLDTSDSPEVNELKNKIKCMGVKAAARSIQEQLTEVLSDATIIFSTTGMTEREWDTIRDFLQWEKGAERFTNLYVGSEVGPFAASIGEGSGMYVFPLTVPSIEKKGNRDLLSRSTDKVGHLFVSRMHGLNPVVNIETGDVVTIESQEGLPIIGDDVLRAGFRLKTEVTISSEVGVSGGIPFVGSYFDLDGIEIKNPRLLVACLSERCDLDKKSSVVVRPDDNNWVMVIPLQDDKCTHAEIQDSLSLCPGGKALGTAIEEKKLQLKQVKENPVESKIPRSELLEKVRKGELPKGVLKRWPLYVVVPPDGKI